DFAAATRNDGTLFVLMLITAGAEMLGFSHQVLLPSLARDVLRAGPEGLGALNAARSIGGIVGLAAASTQRGGGAFFVGVVVAFGASLIVLALAPHVVGFAGVVAVLVVVNAMGALADLLAQSLLQLSAPAHLRGRAGGAWVVAIGLAPLGQLQIGALASLFGVSVAFGTSGLALVALACATAARASDDPFDLYRALRRFARVQETLYPLAPAFDPVSRWFLDPGCRDDDTLVEQLRAGSLRADDAPRVGVLHADNNRDTR